MFYLFIYFGIEFMSLYLIHNSMCGSLDYCLDLEVVMFLVCGSKIFPTAEVRLYFSEYSLVLCLLLELRGD